MQLVCPHCFNTNQLSEHDDPTQIKCANCGKSLHPLTPVDLNSDNFYAYIEQNDMPVVVDFWASWCGPCQVMLPNFATVASQSPAILFAKVNTEQAQQLSAEAGIRSLPTLIMFYGGREIDRASGAMSEAQLKNWIMQCVLKMSA